MTRARVVVLAIAVLALCAVSPAVVLGADCSEAVARFDPRPLCELATPVVSRTSSSGCWGFSTFGIDPGVGVLSVTATVHFITPARLSITLIDTSSQARLQSVQSIAQKTVEMDVAVSDLYATPTRALMFSTTNADGSGVLCEIAVTFACRFCSPPVVSVDSPRLMIAGAKVTLTASAATVGPASTTWFERDGANARLVAQGQSATITAGDGRVYFAQVVDSCGVGKSADIRADAVPPRFRAVRH